MIEFPTSDGIYRELRRRLPGWAMGRLSTARADLLSPIFGETEFGEILFLAPARVEAQPKDFAYGSMATLFGGYYDWLEELMEQTRIATADGDWLDLHAMEHGTARRPQEDDERLRARVREVPERCTERALRLAAERVVGPEDVLDVFTLRYRTGAFGVAFFDGDFRLAGATLPGPKNDGATGWWEAAEWDLNLWVDAGDRQPTWDPSDWLVAVVIVRPQLHDQRTVLDQGFFEADYYGDRAAAESIYRALRDAIKETRAAGVEVWIWAERGWLERTPMTFFNSVFLELSYFSEVFQYHSEVA